jgi:hypothetical protein
MSADRPTRLERLSCLTLVWDTLFYFQEALARGLRRSSGVQAARQRKLSSDVIDGKEI